MVNAARRSAAPRTISPLLLAFYNGVEVLSEWLGLSKASTLWSMTLAFATDLSQSALVERVPRRLLHHYGAAASQAEAASGTRRVTGKPTFLCSDRAAIASRATAPREAVCRDGVFAKTELTAFAGIQAIGRGRAGPAQSCVADVGQGARSVAPCVRAEEDVFTVELWERAASKAVTSVRGEHPAAFLA
jgi:hypothetical protein